MLTITIEMLSQMIHNSSNYSEKEKQYLIDKLEKINLSFRLKFNRNFVFEL